MFTGTATVLLSGGIDSASCTHVLKKQGFPVEALFVDFGQAAAPMEEAAAKRLCIKMDVPLETVSIQSDRRFGPGEINGRNAFLIFTALALRKQTRGPIVIGIHAGTPYFDCSEHFFHSVSSLVEECSSGNANLIAPFLTWSKSDVYEYFVASKLPVGDTYSCEVGALEPCGSCLSCIDRANLDAGQATRSSSG